MAEESRWKLGLSVALAIVGTYVGLLLLAARLDRADPLLAITYLDESAQGLRVDADVQMRGVRIGRVKSFGLAGDARHVEVVCELDDRTLRMLGIRDVKASWGEGEFAPPTLRAFLAPSGLTGVLVIQMDFFDPLEQPAPDLDFEPPWNYVPAVTSFGGIVQRDLPGFLASLPGHLSRVDEVLDRIAAVLDEHDPAAIASQTRARLSSAQDRLDQVDVAEIQSRTFTFLADAQAEVDRTQAKLDTWREERTVEAHLEDVLAMVDRIGERLAAFDGTVLAEVRQGSADLVETARELAGPLRLLREWARWMHETARAFDGRLRPLSEDPSELFFGKPPRVPPD